MQANQFSRTAQVMALFRALESARPAARRLLNDPFAMEVLPWPFKALVAASRAAPLRRAISAALDARWPGARTSGIARTCLLDDWVAQQAASGARQAVILGAGFDSRAWRLPALATIKVYEIDHPATAAEKRRLLKTARLDAARITQIAIDFDREPLAEALERCGFQAHQPTIVLWEGVSQYLSEAAVNAVLRWAGALPPGSALAFTYVHAEALRNPAAFQGAPSILAAVARRGEAWTFGIDPARLGALLQAAGLRLEKDQGADEYRSHYYRTAPPSWGGYAFYRAALATVAPHAPA